jgi:hypothetical protein
MIGVSDLAVVLQSATCLSLLAIVLLKFWAEARLDVFRQEMFALRDELFDYAAEGHIKFNDPAYRLLRQVMNGFIRYGHQLTFFRVCVTVTEAHIKTDKLNPPNWSEAWERALKGVRDAEVQSSLEEFHHRALSCVARRLLFGSPVMLSLGLCAVLLLVIRMGWQELQQVLGKAPVYTLSHLVRTDLIENEAAATAVA